MPILHGVETDEQAARPVIRGRRMVISCGHYLAAMAGMQMLQHGGNAFDAGVAAVFAQMVLEFQSAGLGGETPLLLYSAAADRVVAVNGNTRAPGAATIDWFRRRGITAIPGDGLLPAGPPATPAALIATLERFGRLRLAQVLAPAIELAAQGFPMYPGMRRFIASSADFFRQAWPTSAALFLPGGRVPAVGETFKNPDLAHTLQRLVEAESAAGGDRSSGLQMAQARFYTGDIARAIVDFAARPVVDSTGQQNAGLLSAPDLADFAVRFEEPVCLKYRGIAVCKCGPWSQGPVFLQQLALLAGYDLASLGHNSAAYIHTVIEACKLAFADRARYYGDPDFAAVPLAGLLAPTYAAERRRLVGLRAAARVPPGNPYPHQGSDYQPDLRLPETIPWLGGTTGCRVADAEGNLFSATPSGGWFPSSPIIPGLGFCLGTRGQMFTLHDPHHPAALQPRKQPRTTLSPSLALKDGRPWLAFGTPGGDQQDQWSLLFFLGLVDFGLDLQAATDAAMFHSEHWPSSFYPHPHANRRLVIEDRVPEGVRAELARRGHDLQVVPGWTLGYNTVVAFDAASGLIEGAATARGQRHYAIGW